MNIVIEKRENFYLFKNLSQKIRWGCTFADPKNQYAYHTVQAKDFHRVTQSRQSLMQKAGLKKLITLRQTHSSIIRFVSDQNTEYLENPLIEGDALISDQKELALGILTADCVPILIAVPNTVVAAVHAGWKGILSEILPKTLHEIFSKFQFNAKNMVILIAPHNRSCCYEVKSDLLSRFKHPVFQKNSSGQFFLDMESMLLNQIKPFPIQKEQILRLSHCTQCHQNPQYHSYRRKPDSFRNLSWIALK